MFAGGEGPSFGLFVAAADGGAALREKPMFSNESGEGTDQNAELAAVRAGRGEAFGRGSGGSCWKQGVKSLFIWLTD